MRDHDLDTITLPKLKASSRTKSQKAASTQSRSEEVRARRGSRLKPASSKSSRRAGVQKPLPAARYVVPTRGVVVRSPAGRTPLKKQTANQTRRRYHIALNTPGAEIRLPSISIARPSWRILSGMIIIAMLVALYALINLPEFQFGPAHISGIQRITATDVEAVLKTRGLPSFSVKPQDLAANLQAAFPEFSSVSVKVGLPASLSVVVVERQPVILWKNGDTTTWIDKDGFAFPSRADSGTDLVTVIADGSPPNAPAASSASQVSSSSDVSTPASSSDAVSGALPTAEPFISPDMVSAIISLAPAAPNKTPILYDPTHGLGWTDSNGWQVYFGSSLDNLNLKLQEYYAIVTQLTKQGIKPAMISVEFPHAPFYRMEK